MLEVLSNYPWTRHSVRIIGVIKRQLFDTVTQVFDNSNLLQEIFGIDTWRGVIWSLEHGRKHILTISPTIWRPYDDKLGSIRRWGEHTNPSDAISGPKNTFHIQHNFTCSSVCVIYSITCTKCSTLYIGETCRQLNYTRFGEHLRSVEEKKHLSPEYQDDDDINIALHFNLPNHSIDDMGISALLYAPTEKLPRKTLEKKISFELGTITPSGLNKQFSFLF